MRADFRGIEGEARIFELKDIIAGGAKSLGKKAFKEVVPRFWGFVETRPYMRARQQLADLNIPQTSVQVGSFSQADNRYFLQHCLQEILKRRLKVEVAAVESLTPELVPAVALEV